MELRKLLVGMLFATSPAVVSAFVWGQPVTITGYYVYDSGSAYFKTSTNQNPDACQSTQYLYLDTATPFFKEIYATLIAARATGETVTVLYDGCVGPYPRIRSIAVPQMW